MLASFGGKGKAAQSRALQRRGFKRLAVRFLGRSADVIVWCPNSDI
jgi:hypothetical protein